MWHAKDETFLRDVSWLDALSVKASLGTSGNSAIPGSGWDYAYRSKELVTAPRRYEGSYGYRLYQPANPNLTWEKQLKFTVGFTANFFNMVNVDASFYRRNTSSMLLDVPKPYTSGFSEALSNIGELSNTGIDLRVDVTVWKDKRGNFVTPYIVFNYNRQRVESLFGGRKYWIVPNTSVAYAVGKPVELFMPRFYRVNPDNGRPEWYKANPDDPTKPQTDPSKIVSDEETYENEAQSLGKPRFAPYQGSFGLNVSLWGVYLQCDFIYQLDKWMISNDRYFYENPLQFGARNQSKRITPDSYWKKPGDVKPYPGIPEVGPNGEKLRGSSTWMAFDSRMLSNASFMRLKNRTIGYNFPKKWMDWTRFFSSAKVYTTMRNILTVTKYEGPDPEPDINVTLGGNPNTKQYTFGIELTF